MSKADGYVIPKPGIPKTLGILNVIFGVLLVLGGVCTLGALAIAPMFLNFAEKQATEIQVKAQEQQKANLKTYDDRIAAAKTEEEKKELEQQKANAATNQITINPVDMSAATDALNDPTIKAVNIGSTVSGLLLHILLLISGIGLIRLTPWGRSLGLWWAGLILVQIIAVLVATIVWVVPVNAANTEKQLAKLEEQAKQKGPQGQMAQSMIPMTKLGAQMVIPSAVGQSVAGIIYPIVLLILLNNRGARAACLAKKPEEFDDLSPSPI
jgi:hypothetical protein